MTARVLTRRARLDLLEIADWVGKRNPDPADRLIERLLAACQMLNQRPALGHVRRDLVPDREDIKFLAGRPLFDRLPRAEKGY